MSLDVIDLTSAPPITWSRPLECSENVAAFLDAAGHVIGPESSHCGDAAGNEFAVIVDVCDGATIVDSLSIALDEAREVIGATTLSADQHAVLVELLNRHIARSVAGFGARS